MERREILSCSFGSWYPQFKAVTFKSHVIALGQGHPFVRFLHQDGLYVHPDRIDYDPIPELAGAPQQEKQSPRFPELEEEIKRVIEEFEGAVFPKLNWSSPKDAKWIATTGTLKCEDPAEIFLLLKSSDFIVHDLSHAFDNCAEGQDRSPPEHVELVLRKWYNIPPSLEFRCFVKSKCVIGISQREHADFFPFLPENKEEIKELVLEFLYEKIVPVYQESNYVVDVYVSKNYDKVWVVDFSPFGTVTEPLLFEWDELHQAPVSESWTQTALSGADKAIDELYDAAEFRIVESQSGVKTTLSMLNRVPKDMFDLSSGSGIESFITAFRNGGLQQDEADSEED